MNHHLMLGYSSAVWVFEVLSQDEKLVTLDGTKITSDYVKSTLGL